MYVFSLFYLHEVESTVAALKIYLITRTSWRLLNTTHRTDICVGISNHKSDVAIKM